MRWRGVRWLLAAVEGAVDTVDASLKTDERADVAVDEGVADEREL